MSTEKATSKRRPAEDHVDLALISVRVEVRRDGDLEYAGTQVPTVAVDVGQQSFGDGEQRCCRHMVNLPLECPAFEY